MPLLQNTDKTRVPKLYGVETFDNKYQIVPESQTSKFIKNLRDNTELDTEVVGKEVIEYLEILTAPEETKLAEALDKAYKRYMDFKNTRLDATRADHPRHRILHFTACAIDDCCIYHNVKENVYFPRYMQPIYISRTTYQLYMLTEITEEIESSGVDGILTDKEPEDIVLRKT